MIQHSPGPWAKGTRGEDEFLMDANGAHLLYETDYYPMINLNSADWRLLESAPELLKLLAESQNSIGGDWRDRRDALINKIIGE